MLEVTMSVGNKYRYVKVHTINLSSFEFELYHTDLGKKKFITYIDKDIIDTNTLYSKIINYLENFEEKFNECPTQ